MEIIENLESFVMHHSGFLYPYIMALVVIASSYVLAKITNFIINGVLMRLASKTKSDFDDYVIKNLEMPVFYSVIFFGTYFSFSYLSFLEDYSTYLLDIINTLVVIIWIHALSKIIRLFIEKVGRRFAGRTSSSLDDEMMPLFKNISNILVWFAGIMVVFRIWNIDVTPLLASAGIASFVLAFAAQDTLSHIFGGVSIYFDKPFRVGDRVQLESGEIGDVLEIGVRSTRIKTFDETVIIIPNSTIASSKIINYNQPKSKIKVKIKLGLPYDVNIDKAERIILDVIKENGVIEVNPEPGVYLTDFGDYALNFLIILWVDSPKNQFSVKTQLNKKLLEAFRKEGIEIPYPIYNVNIKNK